MLAFYAIASLFVFGNVAAAAGKDPDYVKFMDQARQEYELAHFAESEKLLLSALRMLPPTDQQNRARTLTMLGHVYVNLDRLFDAERAYTEAVAIYRRSPGKFDSTSAVLVFRNLGSVYSMQRRHDDAIRVLQEAMKFIKSHDQVDVPLLADVINIMGIVHYRQNRIKKAEGLFKEALELVSPLNMPFNRIHLLNNLGTVYHAKRDFKKAEDFYTEALQRSEETMAPEHPDKIFTLCALGVLYTDSKRYQEAEDMYRRALNILEPREQEFGSRIARIYHALNSTYQKAGRRVEADAALAQAAAIARRGLINHPDLAEIVEDYSATLKKQGRAKEAEELRVEAKRARVKAGLVINALSPF